MSDIITFSNSYNDFHSPEWAKECSAAKGFNEWTGTIEVKEKTKKFISATVECRGTSFLVVLGCYYYLNDFMNEWCICVPNFDFGCKISYVDASTLYIYLNRYVENDVDCISLTNAVWKLMEDVRTAYQDAAASLYR